MIQGLARWLRRLRFLFRRDCLERELDEELRLHLEMKAQEHREAGLPPEAARREAARRFGNTTLITEDSRRVWLFAALEELVCDVRYALRMLRRSPAFTVVAIASLALGIGVNTAVFTLADVLLLRKLPVRNPDELVVFGLAGGPRDGAGYRRQFFYRVFTELRARTDAFSGLFATTDTRPVYVRQGTGAAPEMTSGELVSGDYFSVLGVRAYLGRTLIPDDDRALGASPVVVLSWSYWTRRFARDPAVLGTKVTINAHPYTIVGVAPPAFSG